MSRLLVVDAAMPDREASAGERATVDLLDGLQSLGHEVSFTCWWSNGRDDAGLRQAGVRVLPGYGAGAPHMREVMGSAWDAVIVHRPGPGLLAKEILRDSGAATVYFGHDIHQWRMLAQQQAGVPVDRHQALLTEAAERRCWQTFDVSVYPTLREAQHVTERVGAHALAMPYYRLCDVDLPPVNEHASRRGLLMVGGSSHAPNRDALHVAVTRILPLLTEGITVVGDWPAADRAGLAVPGVHFTGRVSEGELRRLHATHLALLAPLRFGAGSRRKLVAAMGLGLPVITGEEGCRGLLVRDGSAADSVIVSDDPQAIAGAVRRLREDPHWWLDLARGAQAAASQVYARVNYDSAVTELLRQAACRKRERS